MPEVDPQKLLEAAAAAAKKAHAPYSRFQVGSALLHGDGSMTVGCNVENASYGLTNCAERTAVFTAIANGKKDFVAIAIVASGAQMPYPCGACRQVLAEFCKPDLPVYVAPMADLKKYEQITLGQLLPKTFTL